MTYSNSLSVNRQRLVVKNQNTTRIKTNVQSIGPVTNTIILVVLACLLGLLYLTQVTKTNAYSYQLNNLRSEQTALNEEQAQLEVDSARLQALDRAKTSEVAKSFVPIAPSATVQN
jgi:outer membrane murein-binding lipoprotein Lpp